MEFFSRNTDLDRRDLLCAGGAGFVSALVATMCGAAKVARAQTLGRTIPEVDRLSVRIVTDNYVFFFMPSQKLNDFSMERMGPQLNDQPPRKDLLAEFGLSLHVESGVAQKLVTSLSTLASRPRFSSTI